jgi:invasion protein IalB
MLRGLTRPEKRSLMTFATGPMGGGCRAEQGRLHRMKWLIVLLSFLSASSSAVAEPPASAPGTQAPPIAPKPPEQPPPAVAGKFGDWSLVCQESKEKAKPAQCVLLQRLVETSSKKTVFGLTVGYGPQGDLILNLRAPLGVALAKGVEMSLEPQTIHRAAFSACFPDGCQATLVLTSDLQQQMRKFEKAELTVYGLNGKAFGAASSLKGFGEGLDALEKRKRPS